MYTLGVREETDKFWTDLTGSENGSSFTFSNGETPEEFFWAEDQPSELEHSTCVIDKSN